MAQAPPRAASDEVRVGGDEPQRTGGGGCGGSDAHLRRAVADRAGYRRGHAAAGAERIARAAMIHLPASVRVYLATSPCDMRRSFDGLHALVNAAMQLDAFAGHLFVFANRRRDRVKILYWGVSRM